jgi:hypothetical protein
LKAKELQRRIKDKHKIEVSHKRVYAGKELAHTQLRLRWRGAVLKILLSLIIIKLMGK